MSDTRSQIGAALTGKLAPEQIETLINEVLEIKKQAWGEFNCKHCGQRQRQTVEITDAKAVTDALVKLLDQAWGKPEVDRSEEGVVLIRQSVPPAA